MFGHQATVQRLFAALCHTDLNLVELQRLRLLPFLGKSEPLYRIVQGMSSCIENLLTHREVYCQDKFTLLLTLLALDYHGQAKENPALEQRAAKYLLMS